jgi:hypothetical protein
LKTELVEELFTIFFLREFLATHQESDGEDNWKLRETFVGPFESFRLGKYERAHNPNIYS